MCPKLIMLILAAALTETAAITESDLHNLYDVTEVSGIDFVHNNGRFISDDGSPSRFMPETMGGGVIIFDCDNDHLPDVFLVNGTSLRAGENSATPSALFHNLGGMRFEKIPQGSALKTRIYGMGGAAADYDGDGDTDLVITSLNGLHLLENDQCHFTDKTQERGLSSVSTTPTSGPWLTAVAIFDADGDGDLDILASEYVRWTRRNNIHTTYDGFNKGYTSPKAYQGGEMWLWLQNQSRHFELQKNGLELIEPGKALGLALWDFDSDGLLDVLVANDTVPTALFKNWGEGRFTDIANAAGIAYAQDGTARAGMGVDIGDLFNEGRPWVAIGNFSQEPTSIFKMHKNLQFTEVTDTTGVFQPSYPVLTFGLVMVDLDLDGWLDIVQANGHVEPRISEAFSNQRYRQPMQLFINNRKGGFIENHNVSQALAKPMAGRGLAVADFDDDGDYDLLAVGNNDGVRLIENRIRPRPYLKIKLQGKFPNTSAIGARVKLKSACFTQTRFVRTAGSYLSQSEMTLLFGLPGGCGEYSLQVKWPSGSIFELRNIEASQRLVLVE